MIIVPAPVQIIRFWVFGSERSLKEGILCLHVPVQDIMLKRAPKEYLKHSKVSGGVLGHERAQERASERAQGKAQEKAEKRAHEHM